MVDNPGVFSNQVGWDLYVNPWWALRKTLCPEAAAFAEIMTETLGSPDLWFQGLFHELLWGPRELDRGWRPGFHANLSGGNGMLWKSFWLPWRAGFVGPGKTVEGARNSWLTMLNMNIALGTDEDGIPYACNVLDTDISLEWDVPRLHAFAKDVCGKDYEL